METYLRPEDVRRMEQAATCQRDRLLVRILFHLGCRVSEALGIRICDVDFKKGSVMIVHLKSRIRLYCSECGAAVSRRHKYCPDCGHEVGGPVPRQWQRRRMRVIPVDGETLGMLVDLAGSKEPNERIFGINRHRRWQIVRDCSRRAGLGQLVSPETGRQRGVSPHRLRDAFAVMAVRRDDSIDGIRMLQEQLGHADIGTTMRYRKVAGQELRKWFDRLWQDP